jgi:hypothetical protein
MLWSRPWVLTIVLAAAAVGLAGCGPKADAGTATDQPAPIVTVTATWPAQSAAAAEPDRTAQTSAAAAATVVVVPNGVGMNYQAAQDAWRAAGLHVSPAVDATGANRLPIIDSNWVVLSQNPSSGTRVESGSFIVATVKKYTDK